MLVLGKSDREQRSTAEPENAGSTLAAAAEIFDGGGTQGARVLCNAGAR